MGSQIYEKSIISTQLWCLGDGEGFSLRTYLLTKIAQLTQALINPTANLHGIIKAPAFTVQTLPVFTGFAPTVLTVINTLT